VPNPLEQWYTLKHMLTFGDSSQTPHFDGTNQIESGSLVFSGRRPSNLHMGQPSALAGRYVREGSCWAKAQS
jgi:hypothetical protein